MAAKQDKFINTIKSFEELNLTDWSHKKQSVGGGGQATGLVVTNGSGEEGVFRLAHCKSEEDKERFKLELSILTSKPFVNHPNIIEILAYPQSTKEEYWYISKRGVTLYEHWTKYLDSNPSGDDRVTKAVEIALGLLEGLEICHNNTPQIIHRDIKSKNVVLVDGVPNLIDFGIAYQQGSQKVTPVGVAPASRIASDMQLYSDSDRIPWFDVYLLAQLIIWMLCERPDTTWDRPLNWKFVRFPKDVEFSDSNITKLKGVFSICADPELSPQNASEMKGLLSSLFIIKDDQFLEKNMKINLDKISEAIADGKASALLSETTNHEIFNGIYPMFMQRGGRFYQLFNELASHLSKFNGQLEENKTFESFKNIVGQKLAQETKDVIGEVLFTLKFRESSHMRFRVLFFSSEYSNKELVSEDLNRRLIANIDVNGGGAKIPPFNKVLSFNSDGGVTEMDTSFNVMGVTTMEKLENDIYDYFNNEELWKLAK